MIKHFETLSVIIQMMSKNIRVISVESFFFQKLQEVLFFSHIKMTFKSRLAVVKATAVVEFSFISFLFLFFFFQLAYLCWNTTIYKVLPRNKRYFSLFTSLEFHGVSFRDFDLFCYIPSFFWWMKFHSHSLIQKYK